ncbi:MAG: hypothetical protein ACOC4G_11950 [Bacillota bacterium]
MKDPSAAEKDYRKFHNLKRIEVNNEFSYEVNIPDELQKILSKINISGFMVAGKLMGINKITYERLEKNQERFVIRKRGYLLLFRFEKGVINLLDIISPENIM